MDDLRIVATRIWDLVGRRPCSTPELSEALFARLRWFPPSEAERIVRTLQEAHLFVPGAVAGSWRGAPELDDVAVPITYRPPPDLASTPASPPASLFDRILSETARRTNEPVDRLRTESVQVTKELGVLPEAAGLLVAWRRGLALVEPREELLRTLRAEPPAG